MKHYLPKYEMKNFVFLLIISIFYFIILLAIYAVASAHPTTDALAAQITIISTYAARICRDYFGLKLNGYILTINFIFVSVCLALLTRGLFFLLKSKIDRQDSK